METVEQLNQQLAELKARRKTDAVTKRIEHLERRRNQILSADRKEDRKLRSRALYIIGSTVIKATEDQGEQVIADWLRQHVRQLPAKDRDLVHAAFPQIFSPGASAPATDASLPAEPAAQTNKETPMADDRDFYDDTANLDEPVDCALYEHPALFFHGLLPGETADADGRPILPSIELISGTASKKDTRHE